MSVWILHQMKGFIRRLHPGVRLLLDSESLTEHIIVTPLTL